MTAPPAARLVGLTAIVVALAAAVAITGGRRGTVERSLLLPGFKADEIAMVTIARRDQPPVVLRLTSERAEVIDPVPGPADEAVVRDLLSALATARVDRVTTDERARWRAGLDAPRVKLVLLTGADQRTELDVGALVPESGQVWLGIGERAFLVPRWIGEALDRDLAALRVRRPFPDPSSMTGFELHGFGLDVVLAGDPLRRRDDGTGVRVSSSARDALVAALAPIALDAFVLGPVDNPRLTVRVLGGATPAELNVHGPCGNATTHILVDGSAGVGCVPLTSLQPLLDAARTLATADGLLLAPLDGNLETLTAPAGSGSAASPAIVLARRGAAWTLALDGAAPVDADDGAVDALLGALGTAGTIGPPPPSRAPDATWTAALAGGATETWAWWWGDAARPTLFRRDAEPHTLAIAPATAATVRTFGPALRNLTALTVEPTAVAAITATGLAPAQLTRGALVGEWVVARPAGATATPAATALVDALAHVRGLAWLPAPALGRARRTVTLTLDAPPVSGASAITHTLVVGDARADGTCAVRIDTFPPLHAGAALCAALLAPLAN